jgi:hypothetical protein
MPHFIVSVAPQKAAHIRARTKPGIVLPPVTGGSRRGAIARKCSA